MMKKQLLIVGITVLLLAVGLSGCTETNQQNGTSSEEYEFLGTWDCLCSTGEGTITFYSNGTVTYILWDLNESSGTWEIMDGELKAIFMGEILLECNYISFREILTVTNVDTGRLWTCIR